MSLIHRQTHPEYVPGCINCKLLTVSISPAAMPTRRDVRYTATDQLEKGWHKDIPAYKRLVKEGLNPERVDGAAEVEAKADHAIEVSEGRKLSSYEREVHSIAAEVGG
jgi:hypothetical protein